MLASTNYSRLSWKYRQHHERWKRYVETRKPRLTCQDCGGVGQVNTGAVPAELGVEYVNCGGCEGTGYVDGRRRGEWLRSRREP